MKLKKRSTSVVVICALLVWAVGVPGFGGQNADYSRVLGLWNMEVYADGSTYYFKLTLEMTAGKLAGKVSENSGMFSDLPLAAVDFDGEKLTFEVKAPTPPDGSERLWKGDLKVETDKIEGTVSNDGIGSVSVTGKRQPSGLSSEV